MILRMPVLLAFSVLAGCLYRLNAGIADPWELSFPIRHVVGSSNQPPFDTDIQARLLDLNGDGVVDYLFRITGFSWVIQPVGSNCQAAVLEPPPDIGSIVAPFGKGDLIGHELLDGVVWVGRDTPNHNPAFPGASVLNSCVVTTDLICLGLFREVAYLAVYFEAEDRRMHYGWVRINANGAPGGIVLDWAYDTRPGIPIRAGAMPGEGILALKTPVVCEGMLWLTVSGQLGTKVILERSEDLLSWTAVSTNVSPFQTVLFLGAELPRAFFRAVEAE